MNKIKGSVLAKKRNYLNLTQAQVAFEAGITEKTYRDIEKNNHIPRQDTLSRILSILELHINDVLIIDNSNLTLIELKEHVDKELRLAQKMLDSLLDAQDNAYRQIAGYTIDNTMFVNQNYLEPILLQHPFSIAQIATTLMNFVEANSISHPIYRKYSHFPIQEIGNLLKSRQENLQIKEHPDIEREVGFVIQRALILKISNESEQQQFVKIINQIEDEQLCNDLHSRSKTLLRLYLFLSNRWDELHTEPNYYHTLAMICVVLDDPIIDVTDLINYALTLRAINQFLISFDTANCEMRSLGIK